jgi:hypothetical protein
MANNEKREKKKIQIRDIVPKKDAKGGTIVRGGDPCDGSARTRRP